MNEVKITGQLVDTPVFDDNRGRWISCTANLRPAPKQYQFRVYAIGDLAKKLRQFHQHDIVYILGHLCVTHNGTTAIHIHQIDLREAASQRAPKGVQELHLNKINLEEYFMSLPDPEEQSDGPH